MIAKNSMCLIATVLLASAATLAPAAQGNLGVGIGAGGNVGVGVGGAQVGVGAGAQADGNAGARVDPYGNSGVDAATGASVGTDVNGNVLKRNKSPFAGGAKAGAGAAGHVNAQGG